MIIEWIGCSGAGKSTLYASVYENLLSSKVEVFKPLDLFLGRAVTKMISNQSIQNILLDALVFPWSAFSFLKYRRFWEYCLATLNNGSFRLTQKFNLFRSILRKTGLHLFLNMFKNEKEVVLVDEGTVHIVHLLFANDDNHNVSQKDLEVFCALVPTPDLIIHILATESELIDRVFKRQHKPIRDASPDSLKRFIARGNKTFQILNNLNFWKKKTLNYFNPDDPKNNGNDIALKITEQIVQTFSSFNK